MTSPEIEGASQKVSNLGIHLCFEPCTLNSWVYNKKTNLACSSGQPVCVLHNACGRPGNMHWTDALGRVY